ncbi:hypothetical protein H5410_019433 [Solanum commersonii]|uniref:Uncharacterized protein n=1 Tax=Solanum commersonii TaxID=4109 RepID=A0A9J5Z8A6_SOLCO|nr:hypothetical protein H5410_019433 [Solanum commersonii]
MENKSLNTINFWYCSTGHRDKNSVSDIWPSTYYYRVLFSSFQLSKCYEDEMLVQDQNQLVLRVLRTKDVSKTVKLKELLTYMTSRYILSIPTKR